ncbi:MAG: MmgE/PrpD family protein [Acetobacteraceae bacterium]
MPQPTSPTFVGARLGRFVAESRWEDLAEPLRHEGRRSLLNFIGCALGVAHAPPVAMAVGVLAPLSGAETVSLLGRNERLDMLGAAFVNAVAGNLLDYDDTHLRTVIHPTAPVAPAALALAERRGLSGAQVLHAFLLGAEVECRIGNAVSPGHYARGWHITSTCGVFGSAAATGRLLGLDPTQIGHALGIAASQSAGLVENLPSAAKNVSVGNAARNGIFAALLAQQGYEAAPAAIEGTLGWARAMGDPPAVADILDGLGERWEMAKNTYKPYPCGIVMHAVIDACLTLRRDHGLTADDIDSVTISGVQLLLDRGDRIVSNDRDARVSIHHCAAVSFLYGAAGLREFSDAVVHDPAVVALRRRVTAALDPNSPRGAAKARVRTRDGRMLETTVLHPIGSEERPLSDADIEAKTRDLARQGGFGGSIDAVIAAVWGIDSAASVRPLMDAARGQ